MSQYVLLKKYVWIGFVGGIGNVLDERLTRVSNEKPKCES